MRITASIVLLSVLFVGIESHADVILKDHISNSDNWNDQPLIAHGFPPGAPAGAFGASSAFIGNGEILKSVAGVFAHDSATGVQNGGTPTALDFRFSFFPDVASYVADPFLEAPTSPGTFQLFGTVSNIDDWLSVRGQAEDGHELFIWEVDVESLGVRTVLGQTHFVSLIPETNGLSGPTFIAASNGLSATGLIEDWFTSRSLGPDTLVNIGSPVPYAAYRVTTVPEPSSAVLLSVPTLLLGWFSSRKRSRLQRHRLRIHNNGPRADR